MEYVDILTLVMDSDTKTTREYLSLFEDVPTQFFVDSSLISDTPITNKTKDGRFVSIYLDDYLDCIVLEYLIGGKGSHKSCTKKIKLEFVNDLITKLNDLEPEKATTFEDDIDHNQFCMAATVYDLRRDKIDPNQIVEKEKYCVCYYLRKTNQDHYFLQSEISFPKSAIEKNYQLREFSIFNDIKFTFQKMLLEKTQSSFLKQLENMPDDFNDDLDYDLEDDLDYDFDDEDIKDYEDLNNDNYEL